MRHRTLPGLHFGLQGFGELGPWDHWAARSEQFHRAGPAVFGTLRLTGHPVLKAQAALLWGRVAGLDARMFTRRATVDF
ncbi:MAG: hypothetical protein ABIX12_10055 [Rubrivivax sp.]